MSDAGGVGPLLGPLLGRLPAGVPSPVVEPPHRGRGSAVERGRPGIVAFGVAQRDGPEEPPSGRYSEDAEDRVLRPEVAEEAGAETLRRGAEEQRHDGEGGVGKPEGHRPVGFRGPEPDVRRGSRLVRLRVAGDVGRGRGEGQRDDRRARQSGPATGAGAPVAGRCGRPVTPGLVRSFEHDPRRAPRVAGRGGAKRVAEQPVDGAGGHRPVREAAHHSPGPRGVAYVHLPSLPIHRPTEPRKRQLLT